MVASGLNVDGFVTTNVRAYQRVSITGFEGSKILSGVLHTLKIYVHTEDIVAGTPYEITAGGLPGKANVFFSTDDGVLFRADSGKVKIELFDKELQEAVIKVKALQHSHDQVEEVEVLVEADFKKFE
jgi:hypothetical protein